MYKSISVVILVNHLNLISYTADNKKNSNITLKTKLQWDNQNWTDPFINNGNRLERIRTDTDCYCSFNYYLCVNFPL